MLRTLALLTIFLPLLCSAQYAKQWNTVGMEEGLSNLSINDLEQDSLGYIWLATNEGISRFDGEFIRKFPIADSLNIRQYPVVDIEIDGEIIWLALKGKGLIKFNKETGESLEIEKLSNTDIYKLRLVEDQLWITTPRQGLIVYHTINQEFQYFFEGRNNIIEAIPYGKDSMIFCRVGAGLFHLSSVSDTLDAFASQYVPIKRRASSKETYYTCHNLHIIKGKLWAACWDNALHYLEEGQFSSEMLPGEENLDFQGEEIKISTAYQDKLIIGLKSGKLYWFDPATAQYSIIPKTGFRGEELKSILVDKDSRIWIGTEQGVNFLETSEPIFEIINLHSKSQQNVKVNVLEGSNNDIYLGTNEGLYTLEGDSLVNVKGMLSGKRIYSLLSYKNSLFVGTESTVYELDKESQVVSDIFKSQLVVPNDDSFIPGELKYSRYISLAVQNTKFGNLLFASAYGYTIIFYHLDEKWHSFALFDGEIKESLYNDIAVSSDNKLFLAGEQDGLFENVELYFPRCENDPFFNELSLKERCSNEFAGLRSEHAYNGMVNSIFRSNSFRKTQFDGHGNIWTGTPNGLYQITDSIRRKELKYNEIESFLVENNNIWSIANNGLQFVNENGLSLFFGEKEGIPKSGLSGPILINEEKLILGGNGFLAKANLANLSKNNVEVKPLYLSDIHTLKDQRQPRFSKNTYVINEADNGLSISVAMIDYNAATKNKIAFKIPGLYDFWVQNDDNNEILLPALKGGNYELIVKGMDHNGMQISKEVSYFIRVNKPFYKHWWFRTLVGLFGLSIIWFWFYNRQKERNKVLKMRAHISRDLHDDVGSLLGSISIYTAAANNALIEGRNAETKSILDTIGDHSRSMIDNMSDIVWSINTDYDTLGNLIMKMENYARKILQAKGIVAHFDIPSDIGNKELSMEKRKNIYLIFKESIHNILKHSEASTVWIDIKQDSGKLSLSVSDDGMGFDLKSIKKYAGNGLKSIQARAEEINADLSIESNVGAGCKIDLKI